jgi:hypothetical protein
MFDLLVKRTNWVWIYKTRRFSESGVLFFAIWANAAMVCARSKTSTSSCSLLRSGERPATNADYGSAIR